MLNIRRPVGGLVIAVVMSSLVSSSLSFGEPLDQKNKNGGGYRKAVFCIAGAALLAALGYLADKFPGALASREMTDQERIDRYIANGGETPLQKELATGDWENDQHISPEAIYQPK